MSSAPSTGMGRYRVVPATRSLQSMLPPQRRGGPVECTPGSGGGMPMTPRNGPHRVRTHAPHVAVEPPLEPLARAPRFAPCAGHDLVDPHDERLARLRAVHLEGTGERMSVVLRLVLDVAGIPVPAGVVRVERDGL